MNRFAAITLLLVACPVCAQARAGEYVYDIFVNDVRLLEHIVSPPQQQAMLGETLPPRFKPASLAVLIRECEPDIYCRSRPGARHDGGVGYHVGTVHIGKPQRLNGRLLYLAKGIELWRMEGDRVRVRAWCRIDVAILERVPIVRRIVDRIATGMVLYTERGIIEGLIADAKWQRAQAERRRKAAELIPDPRDGSECR